MGSNPMEIDRHERFARINRWLQEHDARHLYSMVETSTGQQSWLRAYIVNGKLILVMYLFDIRGIPTGWEVFVSACQKNDINETLAALEVAAGVKA